MFTQLSHGYMLFYNHVLLYFLLKTKEEIVERKRNNKQVDYDCISSLN